MSWQWCCSALCKISIRPGNCQVSYGQIRYYKIWLFKNFGRLSYIAQPPWCLPLPSHQQLWYWQCRINRPLTSIRRDLNYLCHVIFEKWLKNVTKVLFPSFCSGHNAPKPSLGFMPSEGSRPLCKCTAHFLPGPRLWKWLLPQQDLIILLLASSPTLHISREVCICTRQNG